MSTQTPAQKCSWQHYSSQSKSGNSPNAHQMMNEQTKCGMSTSSVECYSAIQRNKVLVRAVSTDES